MAETRPQERVTASDLFLLLWEDYGWSTDIGGLAVLDGTSLLDVDGSVRLDAVPRHLEPGMPSVLRSVFPVLPPMGNLPLVVVALSYAGQLDFTVAADQDNCPDVEVFARGVKRHRRHHPARAQCARGTGHGPTDRHGTEQSGGCLERGRHPPPDPIVRADSHHRIPRSPTSAVKATRSTSRTESAPRDAPKVTRRCTSSG
ncbi:WS/DGAT domain-containing protein [Nocardia araoensis]|uniref:WS/DGAT domain-containing protein n=1 Tax=Nocardia araoensis TaxID=228600 RepID=UPI00058478EF|nr:WS/DGAT domain-containing protein [Nocardia araoensis]